MVLKELCDYLVTDIGLVEGTTLFYGIMPDTDDPGNGAIVCLFEYPGLPIEPETGGTTVRLVYPSVQAVCRGIKDDYDTPRLKAEAVLTSFTKILNQSLGGVRYLAVAAQGDPFFLRRDQNFRIEIGCNFSIMKRQSVS